MEALMRRSKFIPLLILSGALATVFAAVIPRPAYFPYPPGIVPSDLDAEIARVNREVDLIFRQALAEWRALPRPTFAGNPPTLQGTGYRSIAILGKLMNYDSNMSVFKDRACAFCHMPYAGFSGPIPSVNLTMIAYPGSFGQRAGKRTAQRYTYSPWFPVLQYNSTTAQFFGGNFWDSRATGFLLQNPDAEQAQHPPLDPLEMGLPDSACIALRLSRAEYRPLFEQVWGKGSLDIKFPQNAEKICATPGGAAAFGTDATPVKLTPQDRTRANRVFDNWGQSIDFFEKSKEVSPFTSKFDAFLAGNATLSPDEMAGYNLFKGKGNCNSCHIDGRATTLTADLADTGKAATVNPLFTCFGSANEGLPLNPGNAIYYETQPDIYGFTPNPHGFAYRDLGLGTFLRSGFGSAPNPNAEWIPLAPKADGMFQVSTARNAAMTPTQCPSTEAPGPYFQKAFFHNGYIKSLKQLVHFYNTRDVYAYPVTSGHCPPGTVERVTCWPMPEVKNNIDMTSGRLGLTDAEENQVVAFLQTLTDGYTTPYPNRNAFTGNCKTGGSASTQGNESLTPAPPLPPCASAICGIAPLPTDPVDPVIPAASKAARIEMPKGSGLEWATTHLAIIRWTLPNPGGSDVHYGIVRYGTDPGHLGRTARSPIRLNPGHASTTFRVRLHDLQPRTTYYYTVASEEGNGKHSGVTSAVEEFTTPARGERYVGSAP
jgi:cytochrome c peroxidase